MAEITPAILTNDEADFKKKYAELLPLAHYFKELHVDFIDGKFLPNKTILPGNSCRLKPPFNLTAHFMTFEPQQYFALAKNEGYSTVIFQYEAMKSEEQVIETIALARMLGLRVGISINPETLIGVLTKFISRINIVQIMSIHPGSQGQEFIPSTYEKVKELRLLHKNVIIYVDGGVKVGIAKQLAQVGADVLVAGSAIVRAEDEESAIEALTQDIQMK
jgi:ribulose-phosphate 3-epimerase